MIALLPDVTLNFSCLAKYTGQWSAMAFQLFEHFGFVKINSKTNPKGRSKTHRNECSVLV